MRLSCIDYTLRIDGVFSSSASKRFITLPSSGDILLDKYVFETGFLHMNI